tara:strand:+ start:7041 stop:8420 length:1380 start_codon:yes stop_codon:yes gene_type:complete
MKKNSFFFLFFSIIMCESLNDKIFINSQSYYRIHYFYRQIQNKNLDFSVVTPNLYKKNAFFLNRFYNSYYHLSNFNSVWRLDYEFYNYKNKLRKNINGLLCIELIPNVIIQNNFEFDSNGSLDKNFRGRQVDSVDDWTGYLQHSTITLFNSWGHLLFGKTNLSFTNSNTNLLLNSYSPPSPTLWMKFENNLIEYDFAMIFLNEINELKRLLHFKRYSYRKMQFQIGFTEMVLFTYDQIGYKELNYLMPSAVLLESEVNGGNNANLFWFIDFNYKKKSFLYKAEILIDDISLDGLSPNKIAFKISLYNNFKENFLFGCEYYRINRWVGNYYDLSKRMVDNNVLLGNQIGPDAHLFSLLFKYHNDDDYIFINKLTWQEKGGGNINEWPENINDSSNFGYSNEPFPSKPIENTLKYEFSYEKFFRIKKHKIILFNEYTFKQDKKPKFVIGFKYFYDKHMDIK